ncbi:MAG: maleylpyruvate isomerase N-terminal domain-containing protein [Acidimicrobiia bacterium]|nr:maleylpyruvate isomerase N-terminal domain-containing protein [Acidimicrobiia bacterium]
MAWTRRLEAFRSAAEAIDPLVDTPTDWSTPGLGTWTVAELLAHTLRALQTTHDYVMAPQPAGPPTVTAAGYYDAYLTWRADDPESADALVAGRSQGMVGDPDDLADRWRRARGTAVSVVTDAGPDRGVETPFGVLNLHEYLRTRTLELAVHGLDLARAVGADGWHPPRVAVADAIALLGELAVLRADGDQFLLAMTGRVPPDEVLPILR